MKTNFNWGDNIIDSRDIIARHEELQDERFSLVEALEEAKENFEDFLKDADEELKEDDDFEDRCASFREAINDAQDALNEFDQSFDRDELDLLTEVRSEGENSPDWSWGETLIKDSYFTEYAEQLANDVCEFPKEFQSGQWPFNHMEIDWESAAQELQSDYFDISAGGETYYIRA
jgi:hypothetical protein